MRHTNMYIYKTDRVELREQIKRHGHLVTGRVLDIGAGTFNRYKELCRPTEYVRMNLEPGAHADIVGTIEHIPEPDNSFDSIICTQVIGDVYNLKPAFREMHRVLKPGGAAFITESLFDALHDEPHDFWRFTSHSLRSLAEEAGLEVELIEPRGGYRSLRSQLQARYWVERLGAHSHWYGRGLSFFLKLSGKWAMWRDKQDLSNANKKFPGGFLLIARKHA